MAYSSEVFGIDYHTGVVQTLAALTESQYELDVEAFDHGDPKQTAVARLSIAVHGTNPSAPVFDQVPLLERLPKFLSKVRTELTSTTIIPIWCDISLFL